MAPQTLPWPEAGLRIISNSQHSFFTPRGEAVYIAAARRFPQTPFAMLAHVDPPHAVVNAAIAGQVQVAVFDHFSQIIGKGRVARALPKNFQWYRQDLAFGIQHLHVPVHVKVVIRA